MFYICPLSTSFECDANTRTYFTEILWEVPHDFRIEFIESQYVISALWDANIANAFILLLWLPAYMLEGSEKT